ncbi:MAG: OsmC family protein [Chloroflexota bacterium]|nr:OsmC family protein [Chloroflexota bacterium]MDE3192950.1 OsmC family protein [Chloroflexota bacterium]
MNITVQHEAKDRFRIDIRGHELFVDQPPPASDDTAATPTELFVASLASCAAFFGRRFLARHGLADAALTVSCDWDWAPDHSRVDRVSMRIEVPEPLTPELEAGLLRAVDRCTVKATIEARLEIVRGVAVTQRA